MVPPDLYSTFLDSPVEPRRWVSLMYIDAATVSGSADDLTMGELEIEANLLRLRNVMAGDIDLGIGLRSVFFGGDAGYEIMPTALLAVPLEARWAWRFLNGGSLQVGARPGIYADAEALGGGMFGMPLQAAWYSVITPRCSWMAGAEVRPAWDLPVMPLLGLAWEPSEFWRFELAVPRSRAQFIVGPLALFGTAEWRNTTYAMSGEDGDPDELTSEDILLGGGVQLRATDSFSLAAEIGTLVNRTLTADGDAGEGDLDLGSAPYFRVTFGGSL